MKNNKGITLIALVITIIVMLILVGVTISMAVNGGLFNYAGQAVRDTNTKLQEEQLLTNTDIIDYYVNRKPAVTALRAYSTDLLNDDGVLEENTKYESGYSIAVIPKGFKVSDVESEQTIAGGLVIEDAEENQFVWIPVKDGEFVRTAWFNNAPGEESISKVNNGSYKDEELKEILATYYAKQEGYTLEDAIAEWGLDYYLEIWADREGDDFSDINNVKTKIIDLCTLSPDYIENLSTDPTGKYENMVASVSKYGGFYIGRYEAGAQNEEGEMVERNNKPNGTSKMVVKKQEYPYTWVGWGNEDDYTTTIEIYGQDMGHGAVYLSYNMYTGDGYGVTSTLCYGVQWDAALRFIRDKYNVTDSSSWGNYVDHAFEFSGPYNINPTSVTWSLGESTKPKNESWLLLTGASESNKSKNIYDLAGNVHEMTMEDDLNDGWPVTRGGNFNGIAENSSAAWRVHNSGFLDDCYAEIGFRPTLYIK